VFGWRLEVVDGLVALMQPAEIFALREENVVTDEGPHYSVDAKAMPRSS